MDTEVIPNFGLANESGVFPDRQVAVAPIRDDRNSDIRRRPLNLATAMACLSLLTPAGVAYADKPIPAPEGGPVGQVGMSDERTVTHWAHAAVNTPVRGWPSAHSKTRFPLRLKAPDDSPEVYLVRSTWKSPKGQEWARVRIPARHKPKEGWVLREALGSFGVSHSAIRINRKLMRLTLYKDGHPVLHTPVGVGAPNSPTPSGDFWVRDLVKVNQKKNFQLAGKSIPNIVFGRYILMTSAQSLVNDNWPGGGIIGIHGTNRPELIPGRPSHGCVRVPNDKIREIYRKVPIGTPTKIL